MQELESGVSFADRIWELARLGIHWDHPVCMHEPEGYMRRRPNSAVGCDAHAPPVERFWGNATQPKGLPGPQCACLRIVSHPRGGCALRLLGARSKE